MLKTIIILRLEENYPVCCPFDGLAVNSKVAKWMFEFCGWSKEDSEYPGLAYEVGQVHWEEADLFYPCDHKKLWVLGSCVSMN